MILENSKFESLNFDTLPSHGAFKELEVTVNPDKILTGYAAAYSHELHRRNPLKWESTECIREEECLQFYFTYLVYIRLKTVNDKCKEFRLARSLMVPDWIAFVLDKLGDVYITNMGLKIHPSLIGLDEAGKYENFDEKRDGKLASDHLSNAMKISEELRSFKADGVGMSDNAFPRTKEGDVDTMSSLLVDNYICSIREVTPIKTYVSAFLCMKLLGDEEWNNLFRIRYDDIEYLKTRLTNEEALF